MLCNNAQVVAGQLLGQPTEGALLVAALKVGAGDFVAKLDLYNLGDFMCNISLRYSTVFPTASCYYCAVIG